MQQLERGNDRQVEAGSKLQVTDTGHITVDVHQPAGRSRNRAGIAARWCRSLLPAIRYGPYHSADQARRVAADTGAEIVVRRAPLKSAACWPRPMRGSARS